MSSRLNAIWTARMGRSHVQLRLTPELSGWMSVSRILLLRSNKRNRYAKRDDNPDNGLARDDFLSYMRFLDRRFEPARISHVLRSCERRTR